MKQRALWLAVLIGSLVLTGCGSASSKKSSTSGSAGKIVVWDWKSSDKTATNYVAKAKADFAKKHPGTTVEFVAQPFDQYYTLLGAAIQSGKGPDVILFNGGGQLRDRADSLLPLDEYVAPDKSRLAGWDAFGKDGKIYAAPITLQGHPIYYNKTFYAKAGLDPGKPPATWDAMISACAAIKKAAGVPCFSQGNKEGYGIQFWMSGMGSGILSPDEYDKWIAGERNWNSPNVRKLFALWQEVNDKGLNTTGPNSTAMFMDAFTKFEGGKAASMIGLMSDVGGWHEMNPILGADNLGVMLAPVVTAGAAPSLAYDGGVGYGVAKWTKDPALAADMVRSLTSTDALAAYSTDAGSIASDTTVTVTDGGPAAAAISAEIKDGKPALHVALSAKTQDVMGRVSQQLLAGEITVDQAVKQLAASDKA
ncbi:sugar ABC transporter substrate-binding protein [Actinoplanes sp. ATCC 53533]|uniref:ABC transporter substrate-binding protein n=1 Tax=Actinoplanes sp. ATCC 53533 TaxID=1288362 RepID=UPI000F78C10C|nr:extracellular solute-binding protein [Actinoplanes sp. ATCC 53533]RSM65464.1 sugar ABC transporter substrate-binding protein [Actinoplanes sp. ATCC 53533]